MKRFNNQFNFMVILDRIKKIGRDWLLEGYFVSRMWNAIIDETVSFLVLFLNFDLICFWSGDRHVPDWKDRSTEKGLEQKEEREREREEERERKRGRERIEGNNLRQHIQKHGAVIRPELGDIIASQLDYNCWFWFYFIHLFLCKSCVHFLQRIFMSIDLELISICILFSKGLYQF